MKILILALTILAAPFAFASVDMVHAPLSPIVITGGSNNMPGPWFAVKFMIANNHAFPVTVSGFVALVTSKEGDQIVIGTSSSPAFEIAPGASLVLNEQIERLPASNYYEYNVEVKVNGWEGTRNSPGNRLNLSLQFVTQ